jgi:HAD superfamily hydrolase (TIGR01509 family)
VSDLGRDLLDGVDVLLCDADGNLFPSEEHAFAASADVTNRFLASLGCDRSYSAEQLRRETTGHNFRFTAADLARTHGRRTPTAVELEDWVTRERDEVIVHLQRVLQPDRQVREALELLAARCTLAVVSSSASSRIDACLAAADLADLFPRRLRFSAEDSLPRPRSKPDPAIYALAVHRLGAEPDRTLAVEDSVPGVRSAVDAGVRTIGNLCFVRGTERVSRRKDLVQAGALATIDSWDELTAADDRPTVAV